MPPLYHCCHIVSTALQFLRISYTSLLRYGIVTNVILQQNNSKYRRLVMEKEFEVLFRDAEAMSLVALAFGYFTFKVWGMLVEEKNIRGIWNNTVYVGYAVIMLTLVAIITVLLIKLFTFFLSAATLSWINFLLLCFSLPVIIALLDAIKKFGHYLRKK